MPKLDKNSRLVRNKWMMEGLVQEASNSFWAAYSGNTPDSIIYQTNDMNAKDGHTVVFDYDGNLSGKAVRGKDTAYGKGEQKKKFSTTITVDRFRIPVNNGDEFDGVEIGDLSITQHSDSRSKLADLFIRWKDQAIFDAAQGHLDGLFPTHVIDCATTFDFNKIVEIEGIVRTSRGFTTGGLRRPLDHFKMSNGKAIWLFVIDAEMAVKLRQDVAGYQNIVAGGDVRGAENRNIKGYIGRLGCLEIVEAMNFFGETYNMVETGTNVEFDLQDSEVEIAGLRQRDANDKWTGDAAFVNTGARYSRGLIMGRNAIQMAFGKQPDYKFQESDDFGINSESAVEFWMNIQKTKLLAENAKYKMAKVSDLDYGVIAVEVQVAT